MIKVASKVEAYFSLIHYGVFEAPRNSTIQTVGDPPIQIICGEKCDCPDYGPCYISPIHRPNTKTYPMTHPSPFFCRTLSFPHGFRLQRDISRQLEPFLLETGVVHLTFVVRCPCIAKGAYIFQYSTLILSNIYFLGTTTFEPLVVSTCLICPKIQKTLVSVQLVPSSYTFALSPFNRHFENFITNSY